VETWNQLVEKLKSNPLIFVGKRESEATTATTTTLPRQHQRKRPRARAKRAKRASVGTTPMTRLPHHRPKTTTRTAAAKR